MADQLYMDLRRDLPEDEIDQRMMAAGVAALTSEERAMRQMTLRLHLSAAALRALVKVGLNITPVAGTA